MHARSLSFLDRKMVSKHAADLLSEPSKAKQGRRQQSVKCPGKFSVLVFDKFDPGSSGGGWAAM